MRESGTKQERISIPYFEGVNSTVQHVIARKTELAHMENARAPIIGVLEKRQGQTTLGTAPGGGVFETLGNFGLFYFPNEYATANQGLIRVTTVNGVSCNIYILNNSDEWVDIALPDSSGMSLSTCDFANVDGNVVIVNGTDENRMVNNDITDVSTSSDAGSLFNSPMANKVAFYKSRIYLADYTPSGGARLKTTILRSSYPLGIIALLNEDVTAAESGTWHLPVTDSRYFYTDTGMNVYEIYRGNTLVATVTINGYTETEITATSGNVTFEAGFSSFLSADEVWVNGTFTGEKQYRWISNSGSIGRDVKQYDTFKLVGGDEDGVTMLEPIGNILMIANKNAIMTWNDYNLENFDLGVGCSSKNGYTKLKGSLYFLHYSGIYSTSGAMPQLLSRKVERYIRGATKAGLEEAAAGYKGLSVFFTIGDVTLYNNDGSIWKVLPDVCLEFNVADQNWYVHTNVVSTQFETFVDTLGAERLAMCSLTASQPPTYGPELITNGSFTGSASGWTLGAGWAYGDNDAVFNNP